jgi:transcriptional regulator with XRE-family HTH domain
MITGRQIRAARGLLGWDAIDLAKKADLTRETVSKIENEAVQAHEKTLANIVRAFDENGVEFTENSGVRLKPQGLEVLNGKRGLQEFFNNVYEYMRVHGGKIVQIGINENQFVEIVGSEFAEEYKIRMGKVVEERKDITVLAILREGDTNFMYSNYNQYRWISNDVFAPVPFYIYGDTLAIMDFQTVPPPTIIVHKFPAITRAYRKQFDVFWEISREPRISKNAEINSKLRKK